MSQFTADLITFTEEILNGKLHFLCTVFDRVLNTPVNLIYLNTKCNVCHKQD